VIDGENTLEVVVENEESKQIEEQVDKKESIHTEQVTFQNYSSNHVPVRRYSKTLEEDNSEQVLLEQDQQVLLEQDQESIGSLSSEQVVLQSHEQVSQSDEQVLSKQVTIFSIGNPEEPSEFEHETVFISTEQHIITQNHEDFITKAEKNIASEQANQSIPFHDTNMPQIKLVDDSVDKEIITASNTELVNEDVSTIVMTDLQVDNIEEESEGGGKSFVVEFFTQNGDSLKLSDATTYHIATDGTIIFPKSGQIVYPKHEEENDDTGELNTDSDVPRERRFKHIFEKKCENNSCDISCTVCGRNFKRLASLNNHLGMHSKEKRKHKCETCGETFAWKSTLNRHNEKVHSNRPKKLFPCEACDKVYLSQSMLTDHLRRDHQKERKNECPNCEKVFYKSHDLKVHLRTHMGLKPYVCSTCGKGFTHSSHIIRHERTHSGNRPYKCHKCNKSFTQSGTLKMHLAKHSRDERSAKHARDEN
jgi:DNA-directed RNA polymerase subunit RPC12/RpoP